MKIFFIEFIRACTFFISIKFYFDIIRRRKLPYKGVFVSPKQLNKTYEELSMAFPGRVFMYKAGRQREISFDNEGIYVLS